MKKSIIVFVFLVTLSLSKYLHAQTSAYPFLLITPNARAGGMGETGIATTPDEHSIFWNTAKLPFAENGFGASVSYTPWLRELVSDFYITHASAFFQLTNESALTTSFNYFSQGKITFTTITGVPINTFHPYEWTAHVGYAWKLNEHFSAGLNLGFVYSNLVTIFSSGQIPVKPSVNALADLSLYYSHPVSSSMLKKYAAGLTLSNLGTKSVYENTGTEKIPPPTTISFGSSATLQDGKSHELLLTTEIKQTVFTDSLPFQRWEPTFKYKVCSGGEYQYKHKLFFRGGYFAFIKNSSLEQHFTIGAGIKIHAFHIDVSHLFTNGQKYSIDNTNHFSLTYCFDGTLKKK